MQQALFDLNALLVQFLAFLPRLIAALVIFLLSLYLAWLVSKAIRRGLKLRKNSHKADALIAKTIHASIAIFGVLLALQQIGFNVSAFLAGLGILGFTIGFALQDVSKNFVAGLLLYLQQPFAIGDSIEVAGYSGNVQEIDLRATQIRTFDGKLVLIPNANVFNNAIINFSVFPTRRVELSVGVDYKTDLEKTRQVVLETLRSIPGVLAEPKPEVLFNRFGAATIDFTLYFWVQLDQLSFGAAQDVAVTRIKTAFEQAGIEIPYPVRAAPVKPNELPTNAKPMG
jgi:small-conductance mechanosensitive channel